MNRTLNVSIGKMPFIVDADAYDMIRLYLDQIGRRLDPGDGEVLEDVEARIAEIFSENLTSARQVVDSSLARRAMAIIGRAESFGEAREDSYAGQASPPQAGPKKLRRSRNSMLGGVCAGVAEYFGVDISLVRIVTFLGIALGGLSLWVYIIMWIIIPQEQ